MLVANSASGKGLYSILLRLNVKVKHVRAGIKDNTNIT